jgi:hypothetical protein
MSHEDNLNPADREFEDALRSLSPKTARVDPIAAAFRAGERSARRTTRVWQSLAAIVVLALVGSWLIPSFDRPRTAPHFLVQLQSPDSAAVVPAVDAHSVLAMQEAIRDRGLSGLPRAEIPTVRAFDAEDMF